MKNKYIAKKYWNFQLSPLTKTEEMAKRYDDVINLSIGNPDYPADSELLKKACEDLIENKKTKYAGFFGDEELIEKTRQFYKDEYNFTIDPYEILITAGGTNAMHIVFESILDPDDEVIIISPYYPDYKSQITMAGGKIITYNTRPEDNFDIDVEELEKCISNRTKIIVVNSPNNPTGKVYSEETIKNILALAEKYDFLVLADDIYTALNFTENRKPICAYEKSPNRVITIYSYSKDFAVPGLRIGHIIAHPDLVDIFCSVAETVDFTVNSFSQRLAIHALDMRKQIQLGLYEEYKKRVFYCYERIKNIPNMSCFIPEGTFYVFVDISKTGYSSFEIWEKLLEEAHIVVLPGAAFGKSGEGYVRIACTVGIDTLKEAFDRLEKLSMFSK